MKDSLGQVLHVGDRIAYAVGAGRSQVLDFFEIVEMKLVPHPNFPRDRKLDSPDIKARYLGGHAHRSAKPREFSHLYYPDERAVKLPKAARIPSAIKKGAKW